MQVANRGPRDLMERIGLPGETARVTSVPVVATFLGDALPAVDRAAPARRALRARPG